ncbi:MAG: UDP-N-acetylmuramate dehydrogenase [bacterium]|nr:UDP-N-acetylmuramate dehydrogenase [bacterium]
MQKLKAHFGPKLEELVPLKEHTTLQIGGPAKAFIKAQTPEELLEALTLAHQEQLPFLVIGGGSNLLVADEGIEHLIIKNELTGIEVEGTSITVQSGTPLQSLVDFTLQRGLAGIHKLIGIPGTVGGAIFGNAGAYGQTINDHLEEVVVFDGREIKVLSKAECSFAYRHSGFKNNKFTILEAHFQLKPADPLKLQAESTQVLTERQLKYSPNLRCPGSFFKNIVVENIPPQILQLIPPEKVTFGKIPAGFLLESVAAKGEKLGNIQISSSHANLFLNLGEGRASDFYQLAQKFAQKVKEKYGLTLEPEVQILGLPPLI